MTCCRINNSCFIFLYHCGCKIFHILDPQHPVPKVAAFIASITSDLLTPRFAPIPTTSLRFHSFKDTDIIPDNYDLWTFDIQNFNILSSNAMLTFFVESLFIILHPRLSAIPSTDSFPMTSVAVVITGN